MRSSGKEGTLQAQIDSERDSSLFLSLSLYVIIICH